MKDAPNFWIILILFFVVTLITGFILLYFSTDVIKARVVRLEKIAEKKGKL